MIVDKAVNDRDYKGANPYPPRPDAVAASLAKQAERALFRFPGLEAWISRLYRCRVCPRVVLGESYEFGSRKDSFSVNRIIAKVLGESYEFGSRKDSFSVNRIIAKPSIKQFLVL
jgi:hypothetical protein